MTYFSRTHSFGPHLLPELYTTQIKLSPPARLLCLHITTPYPTALSLHHRQTTFMKIRKAFVAGK